MTNRDILEKAIQKAIDGGYTVPGTLAPGESYLGEPPTWEIRDPFGGDNNLRIFIVSHMNFGSDWSWSVPDIIYNHDFAKALWGEPYMMSPKEIKDAGYRGSLGGGMIDLQKGAGWQKHLQAMVVADDPIQYLGEHLDG